MSDHISEMMVKAIDLDPSKKNDVESKAKIIAEGINSMPGLPFILEMKPEYNK